MRHRVLAGACALGLLVLMGATTVSAQPGTEGFQVTGGIEQVDQVDVAKSLTGRLAETDPSLLGRTSSKLINVIVKLDYDAIGVLSRVHLPRVRGHEPRRHAQVREARTRRPSTRTASSSAAWGGGQGPCLWHVAKLISPRPR